METVIIQRKANVIKRVLLFSLILIVFWIFVYLITFETAYNDYIERAEEYSQFLKENGKDAIFWYGYGNPLTKANNPNDYAFMQAKTALITCITSSCLLVVLPFCIIVLPNRKTTITVTDKRIYGKMRGGQNVDIPINHVLTVSTIRMNGIAVSTAAGSFRFRMLKNHTLVYKEIRNLIMQKQDPLVENSQDLVESLKRYNELLDAGMITQEEFDKKRKELLKL